MAYARHFDRNIEFLPAHTISKLDNQSIKLHFNTGEVKLGEKKIECLPDNLSSVNLKI